MSKPLEDTKAHIQAGALEAAHHISTMITMPEAKQQPKMSHADRVRSESNSQSQGQGMGGI